MSVREEDRQRSSCSGRGLGIAAAAIGVGVGAALYYFFSKRPENAHSEGSPSDWQSEHLQTLTEEEQIKILRAQAFRERTWSLEECSICFEVILKEHRVMSLPCTHQFHTDCITPWLREHQTCPNCRNSIE